VLFLVCSLRRRYATGCDAALQRVVPRRPPCSLRVTWSRRARKGRPRVNQCWLPGRPSSSRLDPPRPQVATRRASHARCTAKQGVLLWNIYIAMLLTVWRNVTTGAVPWPAAGTDCSCDSQKLQYLGVMLIWRCCHTLLLGFWNERYHNTTMRVKKPGHPTLDHNCAKYWPIFKVL